MTPPKIYTRRGTTKTCPFLCQYLGPVREDENRTPSVGTYPINDSSQYLRNRVLGLSKVW